VTAPAPANTYSIRSIQEMLGLSRGVISSLIAAGFVAPARGPRNEYRFTFQDVVLLRTAAELQAARIAPRRILQALRRLKEKLPAELPLAGLRISAVGNDVTVRDGRSQWHADSGQLVMDFQFGNPVTFCMGNNRNESMTLTIKRDLLQSFFAKALKTTIVIVESKSGDTA
jgi:hypothetical protein